MQTTSSSAQSRVVKRIGQACTSCRLRKSRCTGERPVCSKCRQSRRSCIYEPYSVSKGRDKTENSLLLDRSPEKHNGDLLQRIASIETALKRLSQRDTAIHALTTTPPTNYHGGLSDLLAARPFEVEAAVSHPELAHDAVEPSLGAISSHPKEARSYDCIPPLEVLQSVVDVYFARIHGQPYSFFHQARFISRLGSDDVPTCLTFAILAMGVRFSDHSYFGEDVHTASNAYSVQSWQCVIRDHLSADHDPDLAVIQTIILLAIVDFTAGRVSSGWLRLGLAVRLSQELDLMSEPEFSLDVIEREERRRTLWSIYVMDRLISCARSRPAAILDRDCALQLPCDDDAFDREQDVQIPTLQQMLDWKTADYDSISSFGLVVISCSIFGSCTRYVHGRSGASTLPPWDPNSDFTAANALLFLLESILDTKRIPDGEFASLNPLQDQTTAGSQTGQLVLSHALFHLCHCLLNHPFIMRTRLKHIAGRVPWSFVARAFHLAQDHARQLSELLIAASEGSTPFESSFFTYCTAVAAGIHCLAYGAEAQGIEIEDYDARNFYQRSCKVLENLAKRWPMATNMKAKLQQLEAHPENYAGIFDVGRLGEQLDSDSEKFLWSLVDHGTLAKEVTGQSPVPASFLTTLPSPKNWNNPGNQFDMISSLCATGNEMPDISNFMDEHLFQF